MSEKQKEFAVRKSMVQSSTILENGKQTITDVEH